MSARLSMIKRLREDVCSTCGLKSKCDETCSALELAADLKHRLRGHKGFVFKGSYEEVDRIHYKSLREYDLEWVLYICKDEKGENAVGWGLRWVPKFAPISKSISDPIIVSDQEKLQRYLYSFIVALGAIGKQSSKEEFHRIIEWLFKNKPHIISSIKMLRKSWIWKK